MESIRTIGIGEAIHGVESQRPSSQDLLDLILADDVRERDPREDAEAWVEAQYQHLTEVPLVRNAA
jgi:hypothetical protein